MRNRRTWRSTAGRLCLAFAVGGAVAGGAVLAGPAAAATVGLYVSPTGTSADACTIADPCDLATALSRVGAGDTVWFTVSGTYTSAGASGFTIPSTTGSDPITLAASPGVSGVVLDGTAAETAGNSILTVDTGTPVVIDGLTFQNTDPADTTVGSGGAIDDKAAPLTVEDSTFSGNAATSTIGNGNGGAIDVGESASGPVSLTVENSTFTGNTATNDGGAIDVGDGVAYGSVTVVVTNSTFSGNGVYAQRGGAIDVGDWPTNGQVSLTVTGSTFTGNTAANNGGAIDEGNSAGGAVSLDVEGSSFSGNTASGDSGGAIDAAHGYVDSSGDPGTSGSTGPTGATLSATIDQSTFTVTSPSGDDVVYNDGGLLDLGDGNTVSSVAITNSRFATTSGDNGTVAANGAAVDIADHSGTVDSVDIDGSQFTSTATAIQAVAGQNGGAVDIADLGGTAGSVSIKDSQFTSTATTTQVVAGGNGGAVDIADGGGRVDAVSIAGSTFTLHTGSSSSGSAGQSVAGNDGGAVDIADDGTVGTVSIASTQFLGTRGPVLTAQNSGGAVDIADQSSGQVTGSVSIQGVTATDVSAGYGGGAIAVLEQPSVNSTAPITVTGSTFSRDRAVGNNGGALNLGTAASAFTGPLTVSDSTFENDTAGSGGAIATQSAAVAVHQSTFFDDISTAGNGGALGTGGNTTGPVSVTASTLVGSPDGASYLVNGNGVFTLAGDILDGPCNQAAGTWDDQGWNVTVDASCTNGGSGDVVASGLDALLGAPADNGGSTDTVVPLAGNPAIGLIPNGTTVAASSLALCPVIADQRGLPSVAGGPCNAGALQQAVRTGGGSAPSGGSSASSGGESTPRPLATLPTLPASVSTCIFGTPATGTVSARRGVAIADTLGGVSARVVVPAGALPAGTIVSLTPIVKTATLVRLIPASGADVTSFAVSWERPDGSIPAATAPIRLTISDPSIVAGDVVYEIAASGPPRVAGTATARGAVTVALSRAAAFVVAAR